MAITTKMRTTPLANAISYCADCPYGNLETDTGNSEALARAREVCQLCRNGDSGIYKFDAIYTAIQAHEQGDSSAKELAEAKEKIVSLYEHIALLEIERTVKINRGRKPTVAKRYGKAILALREEGKSQRAIAKTLKISTTTVNKFLKNVSV